MISVKKLNKEDLQRCAIAEGFVRWVSSAGDRGKEELREMLRERLRDGNDVWGALDDDTLVGFAVVAPWAVLPGGRAVDSMEVAAPHRGKGIGTEIVKRLLDEQDTILGLTPYPEAGYEEDLEQFYERFGFRHVTTDVMVRMPSDRERLSRWVRHLERLVDLYDSLLRAVKSQIKEAEEPSE
ncbi:MAG: GNAT family N-acetyltransferase [Aigarchaeota archaeon]|nr:GNAT family N-acetyltransferase [Aigarchaeota archaeon]